MKLENEEQTKFAIRKINEMIRIRVERNEIENRKAIEKFNKLKNWFFEKTNKINKPIARLIKE